MKKYCQKCNGILRRSFSEPTWQCENRHVVDDCEYHTARLNRPSPEQVGVNSDNIRMPTMWEMGWGY